MSRMRFAIEQALNAKTGSSSPPAEQQDSTPTSPIVVSTEGVAEEAFTQQPEAHPSDLEWQKVAQSNSLAKDSTLDNVNDIHSLMAEFDEQAADAESDAPAFSPDAEIGTGFLQHIKEIDSDPYIDPPPVEEVDGYPSADLDSAHAENISRFLGTIEDDEPGVFAGFT